LSNANKLQSSVKAALSPYHRHIHLLSLPDIAELASSLLYLHFQSPFVVYYGLYSYLDMICFFSAVNWSREASFYILCYHMQPWRHKRYRLLGYDEEGSVVCLLDCSNAVPSTCSYHHFGLSLLAHLLSLLPSRKFTMSFIVLFLSCFKITILISITFCHSNKSRWLDQVLFSCSAITSRSLSGFLCPTYVANVFTSSLQGIS
jgi:hypothetical protein